MADLAQKVWTLPIFQHFSSDFLSFNMTDLADNETTIYTTFVVITFFPDFFFWIEGWVGGVNCIQKFWIFLIFTRSLRHWFDSVKHDLRSASIDTTIADLVVLDHSPHVDQ